jgi:hypothetical protein
MTISRLIARIPAYRFLKNAALALRAARSPFARTYRPGDFYSPLPAVEDIPERMPQATAIADIDLHEADQLRLLDELSAWYPELPFKENQSPELRFHIDNEWFSYCDATILYCMLRNFRPRRVVEIGSGFSSAAMLDTRDLFLDSTTRFTFVDPNPERLQQLLRPGDVKTSSVAASKVQDVALSTFGELRANDILFVDSSHVVKVGSDVAWILFEILPRLAPGVIIHFHDIPWPFEYPESWFRAGRAWNEAYFLRAFLQNNDRFRIIFFNDFMKALHRDELGDRLPICLRESTFPLTRAASSLWLRKS